MKSNRKGCVPPLCLALLVGPGVARADRPNAAPTATEVFHLRSECAHEADKWFEKMQAQMRSVNNLIPDGYDVHYNVKLNRCFVVYTSRQEMPKWGEGRYGITKILQDVQEGPIAMYIANNANGYLFINACELPPDHHYCVGHGDARKLAVDEHDTDVISEWADAVRPYMTE